ncbi:hypothetical protein FLJC2902T_11460 [Flavobacterium limnosediminis JC2902]|uniref:Uncharacterized protein n=1 Tax=Flavobacterium limnosediminis JC2902 TaxID=1341181 RepID=V6SSF3_9FLAO|nr:hypothetical protein [Flavobacterium limnosediminis]ESU29107.1 hypothetical protein FLJC2902T_11460 [Flavobacterium limnosediminis JC2902]
MPIDNLGKTHFTAAEITVINKNLEQIRITLNRIALNLTADERRQYAKVHEKNKLLINKVKDYHDTQPQLQSPEIDWAEFEMDYADRREVAGMLAKVRELENQLLGIKILRDFDNYTDALRDYNYAKYKNAFSSQNGYAGKVDALKAFFPNTGKTKMK